MLGDHRELEPPDPLPNSEVKRLIADGSVGLPHVRVGHRQALNTKPQPLGWGFLLPVGNALSHGFPCGVGFSRECAKQRVLLCTEKMGEALPNPWLKRSAEAPSAYNEKALAAMLGLFCYQDLVMG